MDYMKKKKKPDKQNSYLLLNEWPKMQNKAYTIINPSGK
jgi:hypothetical protein